MAEGAWTRVKRYAIWTVHHQICFFCKKPVEFRELQLDHLIPKSTTQEHLQTYITTHQLPKAFDLNGFENLVPSNRCNQEKGDILYPEIIFQIRDVAKKVPAAIKLANETRANLKRGETYFYQFDQHANVLIDSASALLAVLDSRFAVIHDGNVELEDLIDDLSSVHQYVTEAIVILKYMYAVDPRIVQSLATTLRQYNATRDFIKTCEVGDVGAKYTGPPELREFDPDDDEWTERMQWAVDW